MSKDKKKSSGNNQNKAEEPKTAFKTVQFFNSFKEQEEAEIKWLASQTPEQHLQHTVSLIKRVFAKEMKQHPEIGNQLNFY